MFYAPRILDRYLYETIIITVRFFWIPPTGTELLFLCSFGNGAVHLNWLLTSTHVGCSLNRVREPSCAEFISNVRTQIPTDSAASLTAFYPVWNKFIFIYMLIMEESLFRIYFFEPMSGRTWHVKKKKNPEPASFYVKMLLRYLRMSMGFKE